MGRPELPEVTIVSVAEVSSLPNDDRKLLEEEEWNELVRNSRVFTNFKGFSTDESEEMEAENISENTRIRWTKEVNKIVMRV